MYRHKIMIVDTNYNNKIIYNKLLCIATNHIYISIESLNLIMLIAIFNPFNFDNNIIIADTDQCL